MIYKDVSSWEFQQIIYLAAIEFENIAKQLCLIKNPAFNDNKANIIKITKEIKSQYPKIKATEIVSDYQILKPLNGWQVGNNGKVEFIKGLSWWKAYNELKHQSYNHSTKATLKNAVNAVASLMVLELYLAKEVVDTTELECPYFKHKYVSHFLVGDDEQLPDFK